MANGGSRDADERARQHQEHAEDAAEALKGGRRGDVAVADRSQAHDRPVQRRHVQVEMVPGLPYLRIKACDPATRRIRVAGIEEEKSNEPPNLCFS